MTAFIVGNLVQATPMSPKVKGDPPILSKSAFSLAPESVLNAAVAHHGLHSLVDKTGTTRTTATSPVPATSLEKRQVADPIIVFCSAADCSETCDAFTLIGDPLNTCFEVAPDPFMSLLISNPSEIALLFQVVVAINGICDTTASIPATNICFNITPFGESWALLSTGDTL
ncbi:hypothetical protein GALMADRAFT_147600 [Galerina marginata CBS 339.88]|uniref:Uncharacterized protein n=1 Tax=Galerina marginata (strain CBS 339.88) TaxID=685588 RepID=A0A067SG29_GALM3|nr:hypothetical protein GALMADRAFT_147600 [Galerina marginata CBS 339.88]